MSMREEAMLPLAQAIAQGLGDTFEHAFTSKSEWTEARGEKGGRYRDINEPMQSDYMDAAAEAYDVMIQVLMEPDGAMIAAGRKADALILRQSISIFEAVLKAASA